MHNIRVGYILVPAMLQDGTQHAPASKRAKVEKEVDANGTRMDTGAVQVASLEDLELLKASLVQFATHAARRADPASTSPLSEITVDIQWVARQDGSAHESSTVSSVIAFCFVPGVLNLALASGVVDEASVRSRMSTTSDSRLAALAALPFPDSVEVASPSGGAPTACIVMTQHVCDGVSRAMKAENAFLDKPILVVGAGGIGCELLKVLVLRGFRHIHLVDLDTIDATNLNRQFLFTSADVGCSKAETACAAVLRWFSAEVTDGHVSVRSAPTLIPHHDNIKSERYDVNFYSQFSAVLNALDNVSARQHVNRMCVRAKVALIESGTMGYNGQVQPILPGLCECYDCRAKPADQKTFAVCTIHARPTTMVHCVHYAKELYTTLFATDAHTAQPSASQTFASQRDEETPRGSQSASAPSALATGSGELQYLRDMVQQWQAEATRQDASTTTSASTTTATDFPPLLRFGTALLECLFVDKVTALLAMKSSWSTAPPTPLNVEDARAAIEAASFHTSADADTFAAALTRASAVPTLVEAVQLFVAATALCAGRLFQGKTLAFRKEDDTAVYFVAAAANLRAHVFHIAELTVEALRSVAGAIVPAIATTNAMAGAGVVQQLERILTLSTQLPDAVEADRGLAAHVEAAGVRMIYIRKTPQTRRRQLQTVACFAGGRHGPSSGRVRFTKDQYLVHSALPSSPAEDCKVCQRLVPAITITLNMREHTLAELATDILENLAGLESVSITHAASILYEEDYESLGPRTLVSFTQASTDPDAVAAVPPLVLVVDALNRDVEWEVELHHTDVQNAAVVVEGAELAKTTEAQALRARAVQEARAEAEAQAEKARLAAALAQRAGLSAVDAVVLETDSDGDEVVEEVIRGGASPQDAAASDDASTIEID